MRSLLVLDTLVAVVTKYTYVDNVGTVVFQLSFAHCMLSLLCADQLLLLPPSWIGQR
jgi:hypothetical protein